jgi:hypothetical protein
MRRYRTRTLPDPVTSTESCSLPRAIDLEVGAMRCAVVEQSPTFDEYEAEAVLSLEDSWRIETALCAASRRLRGDGFIVATAEIDPYGPEGGIIGWSGVIHVQFAN